MPLPSPYAITAATGSAHNPHYLRAAEWQSGHAEGQMALCSQTGRWGPTWGYGWTPRASHIAPWPPRRSAPAQM